MAINAIVTEKELNYIETLYLYANLEDFLKVTYTYNDWLFGEEKKNGQPILQSDVDELYDHDRYEYMLGYVHDTLLIHAEYIGEASGRMWYRLPNYRLGIMDFNRAKKANQFNVEIQYEQSHMFSLEPNLRGLDLPFDGALSQYHIRRVDVTQIVKTPHDYLTNHNFISPYRAMDRFSKNGVTETVYLGHRKSGNVFRMYNKTIELMTDNKDHPIDYKKIELLSKYFGDIEDLYTFELELHRKYLKPTFGIDTLADLEKVYGVYHEIVGKIRIYKDSDENKKLVATKHHSRIRDLYLFTDYREFKRVEKRKYKPSKYYAIDRAVKAIDSYEKAMGNLSEAEKLLILDEVSYRIINKNVDISVGESEYATMIEKFDIIRDGQTNDLEKEAKEAFCKTFALLPSGER